MAKPARILFAIPELASGGPDRVFYELICGLDRTVFQPLLVVTEPGGRYFDALPADVETFAIGGGRYPFWRFARQVDKLRPDLIVTTLRMNTTVAVARLFQCYRPPLISRQANAIAANFNELRKKSRLKYGFAEWLMKRLLRVPHVLVAQSSDMGDELAQHAAASQKIVVIGNPVCLDDVAQGCASQQANSEPVRFGSPALIAVGRLSPQKGFDLLLQGFSRFREEYPLAGLTVLGEGPDRADLEAEARRLGIVEAVRFPGHSDCVLAEVAAADLFVSSSRYEGFSNAILEAMALGTPVVATNCEGGTTDMIVDNQTGVLADGISGDALASALTRAMRRDLRALGDAGRTHVGKMFSRNSIIGSYTALFHDVLAGRTALEGGRHHGGRKDMS